MAPKKVSKKTSKHTLPPFVVTESEVNIARDQLREDAVKKRARSSMSGWLERQGLYNVYSDKSIHERGTFFRKLLGGQVEKTEGGAFSVFKCWHQ